MDESVLLGNHFEQSTRDSQKSWQILQIGSSVQRSRSTRTEHNALNAIQSLTGGTKHLQNEFDSNSLLAYDNT